MVRAAQFPAAMRGYDRTAVDSWRDELADLVQRLEERQPRDAAVKRALDEVGQETSSILQRAHEAAEDITARSRVKADDRLARAEQDADATLRDAEERVRQLEVEVQDISDQRARLIDEMRQLADEMLGVADDALERMAPPSMPGSPPILVVEGEEPDLAGGVEDFEASEEDPTEDGAYPQRDDVDDEATTVEVAAPGPDAQDDR